MVNDYGHSGQKRDDVAPRRPRSLDSVDLELVSMTTGFLETMLDQQGQPDVQFDEVKLWEGWTASDRPGIAFRLAQLRAMPELLPWLMYAIVRRSDGQMVGHIGFHGAPGLHSLGDLGDLGDLAHDALEIGYSVFPPFRRNGYALAATKALIQWANTDRGITFFVASINHENTASQGVATKAGFKFYRFDSTDPDCEDLYTMRLGSDNT